MKIPKKIKALARLFLKKRKNRQKERLKIRSVCFSIHGFNKASVFEINEEGLLIRDGGFIKIYKKNFD